jgi:DNA-binding LacI/PurR family transcriptional regulator
VIGFDDLPDSRHFLPPLSTVKQDFAALGALAMAALVATIEGEGTSLPRLIEPFLIERDSTGPAPQIRSALVPG